MNQLVDSDALYWKLPRPARALFLFIVFLMIVALNANLAYVVTQSSPHEAETVASTQVDSSQEADGPDMCGLRDVYCDGETIAQKQPIIPVNSVATTHPSTSPIKKGATEAMQEMVDYAWSISKSLDFVLTVEAESGFNPNARNVNRNGTVDSGLTQINHYYHPQIVKDPRFKDWKFQLEKGWQLYKGGTRFYGYDVRHKVSNRFVLK